MKQTVYKPVIILMSACLLLSGCNARGKTDQSSSDISSESETIISSGGSSMNDSSIISSENSKAAENSSKSGAVSAGTSSTSSQVNTAQTKILYVEDFGAKGDGVTDDSLAVSNCVKAAVKDKSTQKEIRFQANKTYHLASVPAGNRNNRVLDFNGGSNIKVIGSNTKLLMKAPCRVAFLTETDNVKITGFIIDYSPRPFTLGIVIAVNRSGGYIDYTTDEELGFEGEVSPPAPFFAFRNRKDERLTCMISKMVKLSSKKYRLYMSSAIVYNMVEAAPNSGIGDAFILPVYGSSHNIGSIFSIQGNNNFAMENVTINAQPDFGFDIRRNTGYLNFTNVRFEPAADSKVYLTSWRDGFHVKDNLAKITFDHCYIGPLGDDAFNISSVTCTVTSFNLENQTIIMKPYEDGVTRPGLKAGDELIVYNTKTGAFIGEAKIAAVLPSFDNVSIKIDRKLPKLERGADVAFYSYNKDFLVKNTYIEGTVRPRNIGTFLNCTFNVFWVRIENFDYAEGPVPKDLVFKNCTFTTPYSGNPNIFVVEPVAIRNSGITPEYKCKNIVLDQCTFEKGKAYAFPGNELIIK